MTIEKHTNLNGQKNTLAYWKVEGGDNDKIIALTANEKHASLSNESDKAEIKTR